MLSIFFVHFFLNLSKTGISENFEKSSHSG